MARIDVDDIIGDPDFEDDFLVVRSFESVGSDGRAIFSPSTFQAVGVVQPMTGRSLMLLPESTRVTGAIEIWTRERIQMNDGTYAADIIKWHDRNYIVTNVQDFSNYGAGYVHVTATLHNLTD